MLDLLEFSDFFTRLAGAYHLSSAQAFLHHFRWALVPGMTPSLLQ